MKKGDVGLNTDAAETAATATAQVSASCRRLIVDTENIKDMSLADYNKFIQEEKVAEKAAAPNKSNLVSSHAPPREERIDDPAAAAAARGILFDDPKDAPAETIVSVYRINDLSHHGTCALVLDCAIFDYKLAGCMVSLPDGFTVVVVGGKREAIEKYRNLMLKHIKWATLKSSRNAEGKDKKENEVKCVLLWEGLVAKPSFNKFTIRPCKTEAEARKVFSDAGVTDYWDLAINYSE